MANQSCFVIAFGLLYPDEIFFDYDRLVMKPSDVIKYDILEPQSLDSSVFSEFQQEAISQKEIVFRFRKDILSSRKAGGILMISCTREVPE